MGLELPWRLLLKPLSREAATQMHRPSHENVCWLEVTVNAASVVDEAQSNENAVQDMAHSASGENGLLQELAHVDLVHVAHEPNMGRGAVAARTFWGLPEEAHVD